MNSSLHIRQQHSTELALLETVNRTTTALDNHQTLINIFLDLSNAFDTLDHNIILNKLNYNGIRDVALNLFKGYLNNRKQYVDINDAKSDTLNITKEVYHKAQTLVHYFS